MKTTEILDHWMQILKAGGRTEEYINKNYEIVYPFVESNPEPELDDLLEEAVRLTETASTRDVAKRRIQTFKQFCKIASKVDDDKSLWLTAVGMIETPTVGTTIQHVPSVKDVERVLANCVLARGRALYIAVLLMSDLGLRSGEVRGLKWDKVNLTVPSIDVVNAKGYKSRALPLGHSKRLLQAMLDRRAFYEESLKPIMLAPEPHYVTSNTDDGSPLGKACLSDNLLNISRKLGLDPTASPHSLRRHFATKMIEGGVDVFTIQKILGHSNIAMTWQYIQTAQTSIERMEAALRIGLTPT